MPLLWALPMFDLLSQNDSLVLVQQGDLPIIISAPHGGRIRPDDVPDRNGNGVSQFATIRDGNTDKLAFKVSALLEKEVGKRVFFVIAKVHRAAVDVNRPGKEAYEVESAKRYYDAYHNALNNACNQVAARWGCGILLDLHGQTADRTAIYRGTNDGVTVTSLVEQFGREAFVGEKSICALLESKGFDIRPACDSEESEDPRFSGGYIVQTYGSHQGTKIDAIQLEFGTALRTDRNLGTTAAKLASAISEFARSYLRIAPEKKSLNAQ